MASLRALVIGYGSIGRRHARLLKEMGCQVAVMSRRSIDFEPCYSDLTEALLVWQPNYVVVSNKTSEHRPAIETLAQFGFRGSVLVEKPLFDLPAEMPTHDFSQVVVGYNLRCHPLLKMLKSIGGHAGSLLTANVYVGSYLPHWRPNTDYRKSYSAIMKEGGGVLRDLSHELDYVSWLFGHWRALTAHGGHLSRLEIDSEDAFCLILETECCPLVSIHMNYLDRAARREIIVNTEGHTYGVDLIEGKIRLDGVEESLKVARDDTYRVEHGAVLEGKVEGLCTVDEAMEILETIETAKQAALSRTWIER